MRSALLLLAFFVLRPLSFAQGLDHVPGEVLVRLKPFVDEADLRTGLARALPVTITVKEVRMLGPKSQYGKLSFAGPDISTQELEKLVARMPGVEATSLNYRLRFFAQPNDAHYGLQWNMEAINVEAVWDVTTGGTMANGLRIGVALSDHAIQTNHPDLSGNIWPNSPAQGSGADHGTEVASVMGAVGNNGIGITGVNWDVEILSSGTANDLSDVMEQMEYAISMREQFNATHGMSGLCVVSMTASWGVENFGICNGFTWPLFSDMSNAGITLVACGPNESVSIEHGTDFPANCALAEHIVVTSYGPDNETPFAFGPSTVHLLAPGVDIPVATVPGTYAVVDGNSFAVPMVAGAIALLYSIPCPFFAQLVMDQPAAARAMVKEAILNNTAPFPGGSALTITGGKLDVHAAYQALMAQCVPTCTEYAITLTTTGGPVAGWSVRNARDTEIVTGGGNMIMACLDDGCHTITLLDPNGLPMEADFVVEDANGVVANGSSSGGIIPFSVGNEIPGCTIQEAGNYYALANCNDGSCCVGERLRVLVVPADFETEGTAQMVVMSSGSVLFNGTIDIVGDAELGIPAGGWEGCAPPGCFSAEVSNPSMPLYSSGFVSNGDMDFLEFNVAEGYFRSIAPTQPEVCDGLDNDCDGEVDEDFIWFVDADNDGWGATGTGVVMCSPPGSGFTQLVGDCDDTDATINPGMPDPCSTQDGIDNNCDGNVDEGLILMYTDLDNDGWGSDVVYVCAPGPNVADQPGDCDDSDATVYPGAPELCDGVDNNCDGVVDEGFIWYVDADNDGWGAIGTGVAICPPPVSGFVQVEGDCDDNDANLTMPGQPCDDGDPATSNDQVTEWCICLGTTGNCPPGETEDCNGNCAPIGWVGNGFCNYGNSVWNSVPIFFGCPKFNNDGGDCGECMYEICDGIDNDCDGEVDEDFIWYVDADNDGWGATGTGVVMCSPPGSGFTQLVGDCDDTDATINPGMPDPCSTPDGIDNNCDGNVDEGLILMYTDLDNDGFGSDLAVFVCAPGPNVAHQSGDCDDTDATVYPGAPELCDGIDNNCDGMVDEGLIWYVDADNDGWGAIGTGVAICPPPVSGFVQVEGDCDDTDATVYPGAPELCDGVDNNCDGMVDEGLVWYVDADNDGWGAIGTGMAICPPPVSGFVQVEGDCDDNDANLTVPGQPCDDGDPATSNDQVTEWCICLGTTGNCPPGEIEDCNGNCAPAEWIGDGFCDDGGFIWNGSAISFDCPEFDNDGGDCVGCPAEICGNGIDDDCDGLVDEDCGLQVSVRAFLEGPYNTGTGLMDDGMRALGLVPTIEPYTGLGYPYVGGGGETTTAPVLAATGNDAIVDWMVLELRDAGTPAHIVASRSALVQRDGDVVDTDGTSPVLFDAPPGDYHVALRHRNHLGIMTADPVTLVNGLTLLDLTSELVATHGTDARKAITGTNPALVLWQGDVDGDERIQYTGDGNDRDLILQAIGGTIPTSTVTGYRTEDVNMDGVVKYTGDGNDRDPILQSIGGTVPTNVKEGSVP